MAIETLTIAGLRAKTTYSGDIYYTTDIGQEGEWYYDASDTTSADNIGTILVGTSSPFMRFKRIYDHGFVNVKWFGAKGNAYLSVATPDNDTDAIQAAINVITKTAFADIWVTPTSPPYPVPTPPDVLPPPFQLYDYGGGTVFFPEGCYYITSNLIVGANCRLLGVSHESVTFPAGPTLRHKDRFTGSLIVCDFLNDEGPTDDQRWAIRTANYYTDPLHPLFGELVEYDMPISGSDYDNHKVTKSDGVSVENLVIIGKFDISEFNEKTQEYDDVHFGVYSFGGIKLAGTADASIRHVAVFESKTGYFLTSCYVTSSIDHAFCHVLNYGIIINQCSSVEISNSFVYGHADPSHEELTPPRFIAGYDDPDYYPVTLCLDDQVRTRPCGIYSVSTSSLTIDATVVQLITNGIVLINTDTCVNGVYFENIPFYEGHVDTLIGHGILIAGETSPDVFFYNSNLLAENCTFAGVDYCFFFGTGASALVTSCYIPASPLTVFNLFVNNEAPDRTVTFTQNPTFVKRSYNPDIVFTDDSPYGHNKGVVYVDGDSGDDDNYGFNEQDAVLTFDAALIRVQNQKTLNPIKTILVKSSTTVIKNDTAKEIANADLLIESYGEGDVPVILFSNTSGSPDSGAAPLIGQISLLGNCKLYFRKINLVMYSPTDDSPGAQLTILGLDASHAHVVFDTCSIDLGNYFSIAKTLTDKSSIEIRILNTTISGSSSLFGTSSLSPENGGNPYLLVDCLQLGSTIPSLYYTYENDGWIDATVMRNNYVPNKTIETISIAGLRLKVSDTSEIYYTTDHGQEGEWYYDADDSTSADNIGTILVSGTGMRFKRIYDPGFVNVKWFGAKGDAYYLNPSPTNDRDAIQAAINIITKTDFDDIWDSVSNVQRQNYGGGTVFFPEGCYYITSNILLGAHCRLLGVSHESNSFPAGSTQTVKGAFTGSLIICDFPNEGTDNQKWAIRTATYDSDPLSVHFTELIEYDLPVSTFDYDHFKVTRSDGASVENIIINGKTDLWAMTEEGPVLTYDGPYNYGAIKMSGVASATISHIAVFGTGAGYLLTACDTNSSIDHVFCHALKYGIIINTCRAIEVSNSFIAGHLPSSDTVPELPFDPPRFVNHYYDSSYYETTLSLSDEVRRAPCGIYSVSTDSLTISAVSIELFRNGIVSLQTNTTISGTYIRNITNETGHGIVVGAESPYKSMLFVDACTFDAVSYCFYFGSGSSAKIVACYVNPDNNNTFFVNNDAPGRVVSFEHTPLYAKRYYKKDISFIDNSPYGRNLGAVYIDPGSGGDDDNYGFNEEDPVKTFDAALVRVQDQSILNPVKTIFLKESTQVDKDLSIKEIENADILITNYGGAANPAVVFQSDPLSGDIGQIKLKGNTKLYFRNVDLICENTNVVTSVPATNLTMFGLDQSCGVVCFDNMMIDLNSSTPLASYYSIFKNVGANSMIETKFANVNIYGDGTTGASLSPIVGTPDLLVDCLQINSPLKITALSIYSLTDTGWLGSIVVRNNF